MSTHIAMITTMILPRRGQKGFTLVEVMTALAIFTVITIGIFPLLASSMRASVRSRQATVGKNVAVEALERIRGLPYYVSLPGQRVDILDLYYPEYDADGLYETTCDDSTVSPACNGLNVPPGFSVTVALRFVDPGAGNTYDTVVAPSDYTWNFDPTSSRRLDIPPRQLLEVTVTAEWEGVTGDEDYSLRTLIVSRESSRAKVNGTAKIDYGLQVTTLFDTDLSSATNPLHELTATGGISSTELGARLTTTARHTANTALLHLIESAEGTSEEAVISPDVNGAQVDAEAPPNQAPATVSAAADEMIHPDISLPVFVAGFDASSTSNVNVDIIADLALGDGDFSFTPGSAPSLFVNSQLPATDPLLMSPNQPQIAVLGPTGGQSPFNGRTAGDTTALTDTDRHVRTEARVFLPEIRLFPTTFAPQGIVRINNFTAQVVCEATGETSGANPAIASVSWSASLRHFQSSTNGYSAAISLTSNSATAQLPTTNPQVYDPAGTTADLYLFDRTGTSNLDGYLRSWSSLFNAGVATNTTTKQVQNAGRVAFTNLDGAIRITTAPRALSLPGSALDISIGKLGCRAEDFR